MEHEGGVVRITSPRHSPQAPVLGETTVVTGSGSKKSHETRQTAIELGKRETRAVRYLRLVALVVLIFVAASVSTLVFIVTRKGETDAFESHFYSLGHKLTDDISKGASKLLTALDGLSQAYTSHGLNNTNSPFPFSTLPDIELRGRNVIKLAKVISLGVSPIVKNEDRAAWLEFSQNNVGWLADGLALQEAIETAKEDTVKDHLSSYGSDLDPGNLSDVTIPPFFHGLDLSSGKNVLVTTPGVVVPLWQMVPALPVSGAINFDFFSVMRQTIQNVIESKTSLVYPAQEFQEGDAVASFLKLILNRWEGQPESSISYEGGPVSVIYTPIFNKFGADREVVSILGAHLYWQTMMIGSLPDAKNTMGFVSVLENTCPDSSSFTYEVNGSKARYMGKGDLHDSAYDSYFVETGYGIINGNDDHGACRYNVRVYPSKALEDEFMSWNPFIFTSVVLSIFLFTSTLFLAYDRLVQRRHTMVNRTAIQSSAVVDSLFPSGIRERVSNIYSPEIEPELKLESSRLFDINEDVAYDNSELSLEFEDEPPIADTYNDCTVLVSEIVGFSRWAYTRSPRQVFLLLETIYRECDRVASKAGIFKVETIGECYIAVAGLPLPEPRHAVVMSQFAHMCVLQFQQLLPKLAERFGNDTFDLNFRVGIHSGSVTAGVLRGDKARFQLYGETVTVANLMKNSSESGKIQVSGNTCRHLTGDGKSHWLSPRKTKVYSDAEKPMQTYWVNPQTNEKPRLTDNCNTSGVPSPTEDTTQSDAVESPGPPGFLCDTITPDPKQDDLISALSFTSSREEDCLTNLGAFRNFSRFLSVESRKNQGTDGQERKLGYEGPPKQPTRNLLRVLSGKSTAERSTNTPPSSINRKPTTVGSVNASYATHLPTRPAAPAASDQCPSPTTPPKQPKRWRSPEREIPTPDGYRNNDSCPDR